MPAEPVSNFRHRDLLPVNRFYTGKAKPDTTQLYRELDYGWASSLGRVPTVAIYSLAALAACDLSNQAIATQPSSPAYFDSGNFVVPNAEEPATKELTQGSAPSAIASPESLTVQEFTPETSSASESSSKGEETVSPQQNPIVVAQGKPTATKPCLEVEGLQSQLHAVQEIKDVGEFQASPALSIVIPTGFGADNNTGFISATYQNRTRYTDVSDGSLGVGVGFGDARQSVGVEVSYAIASFGGSRDFGSGGFNVKVHRHLPNDFAVAAGWNGFVTSSYGKSCDYAVGFQNSRFGFPGSSLTGFRHLARSFLPR